jgi:hypothetical protein
LPVFRLPVYPLPVWLFYFSRWHFFSCLLLLSKAGRNTHTKSLHYLAMVHLYTAEPENCRPCWCCTGNREAGTRNKHAEAFVLFQTEEKTIDVGGKKMGHISCSTDLDVAFCFCFLSLFRRPVMFLFFSVLAIFRKPAVITYTKSWSPPFVLSPSLSSLLKNLMMP